MKNLPLVFSTILTFAILIGSVIAVSDIQMTITDAAGNTIGTDSTPVSSCPGPITVQNVKINLKNMGADSNTFAISMTLPEGWDGAIQSSLTLASGEEKQLNLFYVNIPYSQSPGKYTVTVRAENNRNPSDFVTKDMIIEVLGCHVVEINTIDTSRETCKGSAEALKYKIEITNKGKWEEEFELTTDKSWASFSQDKITLSSQETKSVEVTATAPADIDGEQVIGLTVKSTTSYTSDTDSVKVFIIKCYDFSGTISPLEHTVCVGRSKTYTISIANEGTNEDTYLLTAPDWVELSEKSLTIPAGQMRQIEAVATPTSAGKQTFDIEVASQNYPNIKKTIVGTINGEECRGVAVIVIPTEITACKGSEVVLNLAIKNTGTIDNTFTVKSSHGTPKDSSLVIGAGETKSTEIKIDTDNFSEEEVVLIDVTDGVVSDQESAILKIEECYSADVSVKSSKDSVCPCGSAEFTVAITNTGKLPDTYNIKFDGEEKSIQVASGETGSAIFTKSISCDQKDDLTVEFRVSSDYFEESVHTINLEVMEKSNCYSVHLITEGTIEEVQGGKATAVEINVVNDGLEADSYRIDVSGPAWSYVSPESAALDGGKSESIYLYFAPPFGTTGAFDIEVISNSDMASSGLKFTVNVDGGAVSIGEIISEKPSEPEEPTEPEEPANETEEPTEPEEPVNETEEPTEPEEPTNETEEPSENVTIGGEEDGISLNVSFGNGSITGDVIGADDTDFWKTITVAIITLIIILILVVRFAFLFKK